jgi:flagellar biosynthesis/type III secretory pathway M-ring protein FliF/YscJ
MSTPHNDDAQRELERRALLNVHTLAERLGASDKLDRRTEKKFARWIGAVVALVILALVVHMLIAREAPGKLEAQRCELDAAVDVVMEMRKELKADKPELTEARLEQLVKVTDKDVKQEAHLRCATMPRR